MAYDFTKSPLDNKKLGNILTGPAPAGYNVGRAPTSAPSLTPSQDYFKQYQQQQDALRSRYTQETGLEKYGQARTEARDAYSGFQQRDLMQVFKEMSDSLGLADISAQIAGLQGTANKQKRVLEDLPDTILEGAQDVGISQGQLDLRSAVESRPIIRNISDLLNSVSVLSDQYQRGLQQAQFSTQLAGQQDQSRLSQLGAAYGMASDDFNSAEGMFNNLFSAGLQGLTTPQQREQMDFQAREAQRDQAFRQQQLSQDESQFTRSLAQNESQFSRQLSRSGVGGASSEDVANSYAQAVLSGGANIGNVPAAVRARTQQTINDWSDDINAIKLQYGQFLNSTSRQNLVKDLSSQYPEFDPAFINGYLNKSFPSASFGSLLSGNFWSELFSGGR